MRQQHEHNGDFSSFKEVLETNSMYVSLTEGAELEEAWELLSLSVTSLCPMILQTHTG